MTSYNAWDVVKVPFPFSDKNKAKMRPALVLSQNIFQQETHHSILSMITTAKHSDWSTDIEIQDLQMAGLPVSSIVRLKLFTLDLRLIAGRLGMLDEKTKETLLKKWASYLII